MASSKDAGHTDTCSGRSFGQTLTSYINNIPDDLIMKILSRFPVKSLLRFKTVSKHWLSLISDPTFVNSHLRHALENNKSLIIHITQDLCYNSIALRHIDSSVDLPYFEGELSPDLLIVGSYNGIVCVATNNRYDRVCYRDRLSLGSGKLKTLSLTLQIYLWNPATKKSKLLPPPHRLVTKFAFEYIGFGFDPTANDYKVVRIVRHLDEDPYAMVYSANVNAWKEIKLPEIHPSQLICDACVNGVLYWSWDHGVIRYDMNNEVFYDHRFPANVLIRTGDRNFLCARIIEMKDSIAVITYTNDGLKSKVNLWTVDDGFERSWTLIYSFDVASVVKRVHGCLNNNGDILFKSGDDVWLLHNLDKKETIFFSVPVGTDEVFKHTESLVPITRSGSEELGEMLMKRKMKDLERHEKISWSSSNSGQFKRILFVTSFIDLLQGAD